MVGKRCRRDSDSTQRDRALAGFAINLRFLHFAINIDGAKIAKSSHARSSRRNIFGRSLSC
jgi:hypothetical protein